MFLKQHSEKVLFLYLVLIFISSTLANEKISVYNPMHNNCNKTFKDKGSLAYNGKQSSVPENISCSWFFESLPNNTDDIYLEIKHFMLFENDTFIIKHRNTGKIIFGPFTGFLSPFVIATGTRYIEAQLITLPRKYNTERSFLINFSTKNCSMELGGLQSGVISSPLYGLKRNKPLECLYKLTGYRTSQRSLESLTLTFLNMTLKNSEINITSSSDKDVISSNSPDFPKIFFGKGDIFIYIKLDSEDYDSFRILYEAVPDACSGRIDLNAINSSTLVLFSSPVNPDIGAPTRDFITCNWLIRSPFGTRIRAAFSSLQLLSLDDHLVISSPQFEQFVPLHVSSVNNHLFKDKLIISPTNEFWVKFTTMQILPGLHFAADFSIYKDNGLNENSGKVTITDVGDYNFKVQKDKVVNIELDNPIGPDTVLELYYHFGHSDSHFLTLDEKYTLKSIVSPTNELKMAVKRIKKGRNINIHFYPTDTGCNQTIVDNQGTLDFSVGDCHQRCLLIFPSKLSNDVFNFIIETLGTTLKLSSLFNNQKRLLDLNYSESILHSKVNVPVQEGAIFEISRKCSANNYNKPTVKISYLTQKSCDREFGMAVGEKIALSSPNFPDNFPLNAKCHWLFRPNENKPMFYYITFNQFTIGRGDIISFKTDGYEISLGNKLGDPSSSLPDDMVLKSAFNVSFESQSSILPVSGKSYKFSLQSMAFDCGGIETLAKGVLIIAPESSSNLCIWLISVPLKPHFDYTNIVISIPNKSPDITVYDGPSIRSPIVKFSKQEGISSSNKILILYKPRESLLNFKIEYDSMGCDKTSACETGSCMKPEWKCNGINECGDYSDELGCLITSPPFTSTPKSTDKVKTDSTVSMNLISTISGVYDVTTVLVDSTTNEIPDNAQKQEVLQADNQVSIRTMSAAVAGCFLVAVVVVTIIAYIVHKRILRKSTMYKNRWETLSTSNPSYQSEKDCVSI